MQRFTFAALSAIVPLCKGSTTDFGSVSLGSNPGGTTYETERLQRLLRLFLAKITAGLRSIPDCLNLDIWPHTIWL